MGIMMLAWIFVLVAVVLVLGRIASRQLPPGNPSDQPRLLAEQAERIEQLEEELRQLKEQADFTERLLTERSDAASEDAADQTRSD